MEKFDASRLTGEASFELYEHMGMEENRYWLYMPAHPNMTFGMSPMLNSLIYLFTDTPVKNIDEAWDTLIRSGLHDIADKESLFIAIPLPMNGTSWTEEDYKNYYNIQYVLSGGHIEFHGPGTPPILQYTRYVYNNKQFLIGEGSGATFINNVMTQSCNRVAGVCTFGGEMKAALPTGLPLPAYMSAPALSAIEYYKRVNEIDTEEGDRLFCADYPLKQIVLGPDADRMNAADVLAAWERIFSRTARVCVDDNIVCSNLSAKTWILQEWPNYNDLGLDCKEHYINDLVCYDVIPRDLPENAPLVISCHGGGDDCLYHINSCGWVQVCAEEKFLLISPDYPDSMDDPDGFMHADMRPAADHIADVLKYAMENYSIDPTRVYIAGFSGGSSLTAATALRYLDKFAACCVMGGLGYNSPWHKYHVGVFKWKYDMPAMILSGDEDVMSMDVDYMGNLCLFGVHSGGMAINGLDLLREVNKLPYDRSDFAKYGMWGYPVDKTVTRIDKGLKYHVGSIYREDREAPIMQQVSFEGAGHAHSSFFGRLCWDFMSQFVRDDQGVTRVVQVNYPKD